MPTYDGTLLDETYRARRRAADRIRPRARRAVGRLGVRLQQDRRAAQLSVPRVRRARASASSAASPTISSIAPYASAHGADGRARGGVREPAPARARRPARARTASTRRSTTRPRGCRRARTSVTVRSYMAHHQGMAFLSLAYVLLDRPMQRRFDADPAFRATELLLQERVPRAPAIYPASGRGVGGRDAPRRRARARLPRLHRRRTRRRPRSICCPTAGTTSRSRTRAAATAAGATSPSRAGTRTRRATAGARSATCATSTTGDVLVGRAPADARDGRPATRRSSRRAAPSSAAATTRSTPTSRSASRPRTTSSCAASALTNRGRTPRTIELTSFAEVVLAPPAADAAHPRVQQPVRADRARPRRARRSCAPAGRARAASGRRG